MTRQKKKIYLTLKFFFSFFKDFILGGGGTEFLLTKNQKYSEEFFIEANIVL